MNLASPNFHMSPENNIQLGEICQCLKYTTYMIDSNMILTSALHQTLSSSTITLDQVLPARLENYMMATIEQDQNLPDYISNLSLKEIINQIRYDQILQFGKPLVIEQKEQKQFQIINTQSNRQIGFQQKKTDGIISNQIFNSKINNTRSISPQPMSTIINKTQSKTQSQIPLIQAESQLMNDQFMNLNPNLSNISSNSILNDTPSSNQQHQLNKWTDKSKEKILFQDNFMIHQFINFNYNIYIYQLSLTVEEEVTKHVKPNTIIIKKSEDPQFFQQLKNARVASPTIRQVKGSGLSPEPYNQSKSKSPEVLHVNMANPYKKLEANQNMKQQPQQPQQQQVLKKLPEQFKKLLTDSSKRQSITKPFDQNNTKFALISSGSTLQQKNTRQTKQFAFQDSLNDNQMKVVQSEKQFTPRVNEQEYVNQDIQMMLSEQQSYPKSKSQNKKQDEKQNENIHQQHQNFKDQFSFKPQFEQKQYKQLEIKQEIPQQITQQQLVESRSIRGISPQNRSIQQQFKQQSNFIQQPPIPTNQQKEPIQIKLDIKQFMNSNKPKDQQRSISPIYSQRQQIGVTNENGRSYFVNLNFQK